VTIGYRPQGKGNLNLYGSKVVFPDATCVAVDSGPDVVNRKSAWSCGRNAAERNAIIVDRFFDTKQEALGWAKAHPHLVTLDPPHQRASNFGAITTYSGPQTEAPDRLHRRRPYCGRVRRPESLSESQVP
jgi:hypothetical protein